MNDIDRYLDQACRQVNGPDSLQAHLRKELKEHLQEAVDALVAAGMSTDDATAKAIEDLGDPEIIRDGMQSVYGPGVTSLFVEQAIKWKDRRWHLRAQIGLVLTIVLSVFFVGFVLVKVIPLPHHLGKQHGFAAPGMLQPTVIGFFSVVYEYRYLLLLGLAAAVGLFEWKYRSDNKPLIRTSILVGMSLVSVVSALWVATWTVVTLVLLVREILPPD